MGCNKTMTGTAILFQEDQKVTVIENIDKTIFKEIKNQSGSQDCKCKIDNKTIHFGTVSPAVWHDEEIDWDYGY